MNSVVSNQPNARWPHAYVVLRVDDVGPGADIANFLSAVAVFSDADAAAVEAGRLNDINRAKGCEYLVLHSRKKD